MISDTTVAQKTSAGDQIDPPLLSVSDLIVSFPIYSPVTHRISGSAEVLRGISFDLSRGETLGVVGESGSGKSTLLRVLLGAVPATSGKMILSGEELPHTGSERPLSLKRRIQMVFQDPGASLHPRMTVGGSIGEAFRVHGTTEGRSEEEEISELLQLVGLNSRLSTRYPHQLSGGQRQRVVVARALAVRPDVLLCDDPVAALDVSLAAQVLNLFLDLQAQLGLSYVFVTNNLAVLRQIADRIAIIRGGQFIELAEREEIYRNPKDSYTRELLDAAPSLKKSLSQ